jgi:hypothetical protein
LIKGPLEFEPGVRLDPPLVDTEVLEDNFMETGLDAFTDFNGFAAALTTDFDFAANLDFTATFAFAFTLDFDFAFDLTAMAHILTWKNRDVLRLLL